MLIAPFNDADYIEGLLKEHGDEVAGIIVEPLQRIIPPPPVSCSRCARFATATGSS